MNPQFSLNRFKRLSVIQWSETRNLFLVILGVTGILLAYFNMVQDNGALLLLFFPIALCLGGCLVTAGCFGKWSDFSRAAAYLLLPATQTEKFLVAVLFGVVLFIPAFTLFYFSAGLLFFHLFHTACPVTNVIFFNSVDNMLIRFTMNTLVAYLVFQPLFLVIATRFRKHQFLLGALLVVVIWTFFAMMNMLVLPKLSHHLAYNFTHFMAGGPVG